MTYAELVVAIQSYMENQFPVVYLADGTTESTTTQINRFVEQAEQRIYNSVQFPSLRKNSIGTITSSNKYLSCPDDFLASYSLAVIDSSGTYSYLLNKDANFIREAYPGPTDTGQPKYYALFGPTVTSAGTTNELTFILGPTPDTAYSSELHYYYYPASIIQGGVITASVTTAGSSYVSGTYFSVLLTGGTGNSASATVVVTSGAVTSVTVTSSGAYYLLTDSLSIAASSLGGTGSGVVLSVSGVTNSTGTTWLGDNFDSVLLYGCLVEAYTFMKGEQDVILFYDNKYKEALALAKRLGDGMERQDAYRSGQFRQAVT